MSASTRRASACGVSKHVDADVARSADVPHSQHHALEAKQHRRDTIAPGLRHCHIQLVVARSRRKRPCDRAALAIEEAGGPGELGTVEEGDGRRRGHAGTPFPLLAPSV